MIVLKDIQEAVGANPAFLTEILGNYEKDSITYLGTKGFTIRNKTDDDSFIENQLKAEEDRIVAPAVKKIHDAYDKDLKELFGETKGNHEKTYDFLKRKISEIQKKVGDTTDPVLKEQLTELQGKIKQMEIDHAKALEDKDTEFFSKEIDMMLGQSLEKGSIAIPAHLTTEDQKQTYVANQRKMIKSDFKGAFVAKKDKDGNLVFYKDDKPLVSTKDGKPLSADAILDEHYGNYFIKQSSKKQQGTGTGKLNTEGKIVYTTKDEVMEAVKALGIKEHTDAFTKKYTELCTESGLFEK